MLFLIKYVYIRGLNNIKDKYHVGRIERKGTEGQS